MCVCLGFIVPLVNLSLIWRRPHYWRRAANFGLCSAIMAIGQWGFFSVPHLPWHGASIYNGHIRGPVTLTQNAEGLTVGLSLPVFYDLGLSRLGFEHRTFHLRANSLIIFDIGPAILEENIFKRDKSIFGLLISSPFRKRQGPVPEPNWIPYIQECSVPFLVEIFIFRRQ